MRSHRTRTSRFQRVVPKPDLVIEETTTTTPSIHTADLVPSRQRERREYVATDEDNAAFERVASELLESMGVEFKIAFEHADYQRVSVEVGEQDAGLLIGKRGSGIDALETLISRMASHQCEHAVPVQADVNGYRARREEDLREDAVARAERVLKTGDDDEFPPLGARDRRIVHVAIKALGIPVSTYSVGHGGTKSILIRRNDADATD